MPILWLWRVVRMIEYRIWNFLMNVHILPNVCLCFFFGTTTARLDISRQTLDYDCHQSDIIIGIHYCATSNFCHLRYTLSTKDVRSFIASFRKMIVPVVSQNQRSKQRNRKRAHLNPSMYKHHQALGAVRTNTPSKSQCLPIAHRIYWLLHPVVVVGAIERLGGARKVLSDCG